MDREYQKYEFCKDVECIDLKWSLDLIKQCCYMQDSDCQYTAKQFHQWLNENGFKITKEAEAQSVNFEVDDNWR